MVKTHHSANSRTREAPSRRAVAIAVSAAGLWAVSHRPAEAIVVERIWHVFSRACYNGPMETVTYNPARVERMLSVESEQSIFRSGRYFSIGVHADPWRMTWRSYAGTCCWAMPSFVTGRHYAELPQRNRYLMHTSSATDCNLGEW